MEIKNEESESVSGIKINGLMHMVTQRPGYIKVDMGGVQGWTSVWADTFPNLLAQVKRALAGGQ